MTKFYILALAAAAAVTANAEGRQQAVQQSINLERNDRTELSAPLSLVKKDAPRKTGAFTSVSEMNGAWTLTCNPLLQGMSSEWDLFFEVTDAEAGEIAITGWPQGFTIPATVDLAAGTFTMPANYLLGIDRFGDNQWFYLKDVDADGNLQDGASTVDSTVGTLTEGAIEFPWLDVWAIGDPNQEQFGYWYLSYANAMAKAIEVDPNIGWEPNGTATFWDGWMIPYYGVAPSDYAWTVHIDKSTEVEGQYRINCPYLEDESPLGGSAGYIVFNISDPEFVQVLPNIYSGIKFNGDKLYFFNVEGFYTYAGYEKDLIMEAFADDELTWSYYDNGTAYIYNCVFDDKTPCTTFYNWLDEEGNLLADQMQSRIIFDLDPVSVGSLVDSNNAPVEFYNLQGIKVVNPEAGQMLIKRTGKAVVKTIIR